MRPPILVGVGLALLIILAGLLAPVLRNPGRKRAEKAQELALLSERELARSSLTLTRLASLSEMPELQQPAELATAAAAASQQLREISEEYARLARTAQELAEKDGLPTPIFVPLTVDAAGLQRAWSDFLAEMKANDALLKAALNDAQAGVQQDGGAVGVAQALGMVEYVQAADRLVEAQGLRARQAAAQARLLDVGSRWKLAQGRLDYFRGLDAAPILAQLRTQLDELGAMREDGAAAAADLSAQVAQRQQELTQAEQALQEATANLRALEEQGFPAGDDQAFSAYRQRYLQLSQRVREFQIQEQELRYGGRRGAELVGEDPATASVQGGETVVGLEELQRRLTTAQERARRLDSANLSLEDHIRYVTESGRQAQGEIARYQGRLRELEAAQKTIIEEIQALAAEAFNKEAEALQAAEKSIAAFGQAQRAAQAWIQTARDLQRDKDPNRKNLRLMLVTRDPYFEHVSRSAEAAARVLAAQICAQRVESNQRLIDDMRVFVGMYTDPKFSFDPSTFQTHLDTARQTGLRTLEEARLIYAGISERLSNQPTLWVPLAGLAAVHHLMARIDPSQATTQLAEALKFIGQALEKREQSPYLRPLLPFRAHLAAGQTPTSEPEKKKEKPEEEGDFFLDK